MINEKDSIELIVAIVAVIIGGVGLTVGSIALAFTIGIKNSTHQVIWKPLEEPKVETEDDEDPFIYSEEENPNKKLKPKEDDEDFVDLSDPSVTSNDWR